MTGNILGGLDTAYNAIAHPINTLKAPGPANIMQLLPIGYSTYEKARQSGKGIIESFKAASAAMDQRNALVEHVKERLDEFSKNPDMATQKTLADGLTVLLPMLSGLAPEGVGAEAGAAGAATEGAEGAGLVRQVIKGGEAVQPEIQQAATSRIREMADSVGVEKPKGPGPALGESPEDFMHRISGTDELPPVNGLDTLPPVPKGHVRLYRGEGLPEHAPGETSGRWFTDDPRVAQSYQQGAGENGKVYYIDVPADVAKQANAVNHPTAINWSTDPKVEYLLPKEYKGLGTEIDRSGITATQSASTMNPRELSQELTKKLGNAKQAAYDAEDASAGKALGQEKVNVRDLETRLQKNKDSLQQLQIENPDAAGRMIEKINADEGALQKIHEQFKVDKIDKEAARAANVRYEAAKDLQEAATDSTTPDGLLDTKKFAGKLNGLRTVNVKGKQNVDRLAQLMGNSVTKANEFEQQFFDLAAKQASAEAKHAAAVKLLKRVGLAALGVETYHLLAPSH
jgi:hypothetical protein